MISIESEITKKLLNYFFLNESESVYVNELTELLQVDKRNMVKKLKELEEEGLFVSEMKGNQKYYQISQAHPLYTEYKSIFLKTAGLEKAIKDILKDIDGVEYAFIYGSYAKDTWNAGSDIDLAVIGNHSIVRLQEKLNEIQKQTGREINTLNLNSEEFEEKKQEGSFLKNILDNPIVELIK